MKITELEQIIKSYDKKIEKNARINRNIMQKLLLEKPEIRLGREKLEAIFYVLSPFILVLIAVVTDIQFHLNTTFFIGMGLFVGVYTIVYIWDIKYFLLLRNINFSDTILSIKKKIIELEKYKLKKTTIRYTLMPIAIGGILIMLLQKPVSTPDFIGMLILMIVIFTFSIYFRWNAIKKQFKNLNKEIRDLEDLAE